MDKQTTVIEVNGIKLEVDLRTARRIDTLRIGDRVKCLVKGYSDFRTFPGVVVGFEPFPTRPSVVVAYLDTGYGSEMLKFHTFNADTKDFEIIADIDNNALEIDRANVVQQFDREIAKKHAELQEMEAKKAYFLERFGRYFQQFDTVSTS